MDSLVAQIVDKFKVAYGLKITDSRAFLFAIYLAEEMGGRRFLKQLGWRP